MSPASVAPPTQQAAALFTLAEQGQLEFALALLTEMWPKGHVSPSAACWLIDKCLQSDAQYVQIEAADILRQNAASLPSSEACYDWPQVIVDTWPPELAPRAGLKILAALAICLASQPMSGWASGCLYSAISVLAAARNADKNVAVRSNATVISWVLLRKLPPAQEGAYLSLSGGGRLDLSQLASEIEQEIEGARGTGPYTIAQETLLEEWAGLPISVPTPEDPPSTAPGGGEPTP